MVDPASTGAGMVDPAATMALGMVDPAIKGKGVGIEPGMGEPNGKGKGPGMADPAAKADGMGCCPKPVGRTGGAALESAAGAAQTAKALEGCVANVVMTGDPSFAGGGRARGADLATTLANAACKAFVGGIPGNAPKAIICSCTYTGLVQRKHNYLLCSLDSP